MTSASALTLHHFSESSASYRVRIALGLKGLSFDSVLVDIREREQHAERYRALNPQGLVPCLEVGEHCAIGQSSAMLEYLEEVGMGHSLLPRTAAERAEARSLSQLIISDVAPFQKTTLQRYLTDAFDFDEGAIGQWLSFWMGRGLRPIEAMVRNRVSQGGFVFGGQPGWVECCLVPQLYNLRKFAVDLGPFPQLQALEARCVELPAFEAAHPCHWRGLS
ncbi:MAG: maleylacetoacetate isomerase [Pseudomonadota bacterium]